MEILFFGKLLMLGAVSLVVALVLKVGGKKKEQKVKDLGKVNKCTDCGKQFGATQRTTFTKSGWPILRRIPKYQQPWVEVDVKKRIRIIGKLLEVKVLCPFCADQLRQVIEEEKSSQSRRSAVFLIFLTYEKVFKCIIVYLLL